MNLIFKRFYFGNYFILCGSVWNIESNALNPVN